VCNMLACIEFILDDSHMTGQSVPSIAGNEAGKLLWSVHSSLSF
jgi:hypothetical protein